MTARLLTTGELVRLLQQGDPTGQLPVRFRVFDEAAGADACPVAYGEVEAIPATFETGMATEAGDRDVLQLDLVLFCP